MAGPTLSTQGIVLLKRLPKESFQIANHFLF